MRVFRDRSLDDVEVIKRHRLPRKFLVQLVELVKRTWSAQLRETTRFRALPRYVDNLSTPSPIISKTIINVYIV